MTINYLAIIPARGGSKRIPRKNLAVIAEKPLIAYTIEAALESRYLSRVIVSTEDPEIAAVARQYHGEAPFLRPVELAGDQSALTNVIHHLLEALGEETTQIDAVVLLQPTSPFRTGKHIDEAIILFEKSAADTVTAVCLAEKHPYYAWTLSNEELAPFFSIGHQTLDRNELPPVYYENGSIYIIDKKVLYSGTIYGKRIIPYYMTAAHSVDVDTPMDLLWANFMMNGDAKRMEEINGA